MILGVLSVLALALTSEDRMRRITAVCSDMSDYEKNCYQSIHGMWGMATGGIFGVGLGNSQEKYGWLPAAGNDFIFAIVGEELGLIGCLVVLALFATFAIGVFHIIRKTNDPFIRIAAGGITRASAFCAVRMSTWAVMPGMRPSGTTWSLTRPM